MKKSSRKQSARKLFRKKPQYMLPTLVAMSGACVLSPLAANAIELGEVTVSSTLGQPLRASIAYALNPHEQLSDYCIYLRPAPVDSAMPTVSRAIVSVTANNIVLTGNTPIREPLLSMQVAVDCPYTPNLVRDYTLMIDPARPEAGSAAGIDREMPATAVQQAAAALRTPRQAPARAVPQRAAAAEIRRGSSPSTNSSTSDAAIDMNSSYVVQPGDTVSTIVSRVQGRTLRLWPAVSEVYEANRDAFIGDDVNRLMAGTVLFVPDLRSKRGVTADAARQVPSAPTAEVTRPVTETVREPASNATSTAVADEAPARPASASAARDESRPVVVTDSAPANVPSTVEARIADSIVTAPASANVTTPAVSDVPVVTRTATAPGNNGLKWLGGIGLALILGLLLFGRMIRARFGPDAAKAELAPARRHDDDPTQRNPVIDEVDFDFEDTVNSRAFSLDADLEAGTGFQENSDMHVAQDFSFSGGDEASGIDIGVADEERATDGSGTTDIIAPHMREEPGTILESEEPPAAEYEMSMIVDATKQTLGDYDDTAKDLQAIQVDAEDDDYTLTGGTLTSEIDYRILEQDYEDELTATQILNQQIEKAARELADRMDESESEADTANLPEIDPASELPERHLAAPLAADDATAILPESVINEAAGGPGFELPAVSDSGITAELTTTTVSSEFEAENDAVVADNELEITHEMAASGSDVLLDSQRIEKKKS